MSKVSASLESKSKDDLSLEGKGTDTTWEKAEGTWADHTESKWNSIRKVGTLPTKTKDDLSLETK